MLYFAHFVRLLDWRSQRQHWQQCCWDITPADEPTEQMVAHWRELLLACKLFKQLLKRGPFSARPPISTHTHAQCILSARSSNNSQQTFNLMCHLADEPSPPEPACIRHISLAAPSLVKEPHKSNRRTCWCRCHHHRRHRHCRHRSQ